ncbi:hypothetical protein [Streptomyces sp. NPDC018610]|uniref:hypothetical protein n=1 Tax=Streptomyces sp. NPDC018610 TaxID=3365049 RepID=UPI0037873995
MATCTLMAASCSGSDSAVDTSRLTDQEKQWVDFSYAHEKNDQIKRNWEELSAEGVKSYLHRQRPRLCGDTAELLRSLKEAGYTAEEMQEYKEKTEELICSHL